MVHLLIKMNFHYLPESIAFVILGEEQRERQRERHREGERKRERRRLEIIILLLGFLVGGGMFIFSYFFGGHDYSVSIQ